MLEPISGYKRFFAGINEPLVMTRVSGAAGSDRLTRVFVYEQEYNSAR